mmetsp:Transcript_32139/g.85746  ORF Transcript_32139/g.85746 Transcript_32139/m.85746 type:complete len:85 (-) Transcript_32139:116-370(-)
MKFVDTDHLLVVNVFFVASFGLFALPCFGGGMQNSTSLESICAGWMADSIQDRIIWSCSGFKYALCESLACSGAIHRNNHLQAF